MFRTKCKEHDHSSFYQFLQMEQSQKNTDCYFFYYSTCRKGDSCPFRHEPSALGCETMCSYWQQGNCLNEHCNFRHMELKKNRKSIPCYWETQPGGCRKPHCSFLHKNARTITGEPINPVKTSDITSKSLNQEWLNRTEDTKYDGCSTESEQGRGSSEAGSFIGSPAVDPLIVKFEEESDNESIPSPVKPRPVKRVSYCKTYEEIRLEEIQAESAAYYSYEADDYRAGLGGGKVGKTMTRIARNTSTATSRRVPLYSTVKLGKQQASPDFKILTLEEIRQRKKLNQRNSEEEEILRNAVKSFDGSEATNDSSTRPLKRRRIETLVGGAAGEKKMVEEAEADEEVETLKHKSRVPPIRLKRSIRRLAEESTEGSTDSLKPNEEDQLSATRKQEVEVRLCDSSTDEVNRLALGKPEEKTQEKTNADNESKSSQVYCDSMLNITEDEYLALDTASDDILKDIDAILKEKTPV